MKKVKVSRSVGDLIVTLTEGYNNEEIVSLYTAKSLVKEIYEIRLDTLIRALYIGYEVEQTPEDKVKEYYSNLIRLRNESPTPAISGDLYGKMDAVKKVLNLLNIKISGVND